MKKVNIHLIIYTMGKHICAHYFFQYTTYKLLLHTQSTHVTINRYLNVNNISICFLGQRMQQYFLSYGSLYASLLKK
jgi:hypothetical protein